MKSKNAVNDYPAGRGYNTIAISGSGYTISGSDVVLQAGGLTNSGANNIVSLPLTLGAAQTIAVTSGDLTMAVPAYIDTNGHNLTLDSAGTFDFNGLDITGTGGLIVNGGARCELANTLSNTYSGGTMVVNPTPTPSNQGVTLYLDAAAGAVAIPGSITIGDSTGFDQAYVVRLVAPNQIANTAAVTINASGLLDFNGYNSTIGPLTMTGGFITTGDNPENHGTLTLTAGVQVAATATAVIEGYLSLGMGSAAQTFQVASAAGGPNLALNVTGIVSGGPDVELIKSGAGMMQLSTDNTYQGPTLVSGGTLVAASTKALGASPATTVLANAVLRYTNPNGPSPYGFAPEPITLSSGGMLQGSGTGTIQVPGQIALQGAGDTLEADANTVLALTGVVTGPGGFTKWLQGEVDLYGTNTYMGSTTVTNGALGIYNKAALSSSGVKVNALATLMLANNVSCLPEALTLAGTLSGSGTWPGSATLTGNADINAGLAGSLTVSGPIDGPAADSLTIGNATAYPAATSTVLLSAANTYAGPTVVSVGTLAISNSSALGIPGGSKTNNGTTVDSGATLELLGGVSVPGSESLTLGSGSTGMGTLLNASGNNTWNGPLVMALDSIFSAAAGALTIDAIISDPGPKNPSNLFKTGAGTLILAGANAYGGRTLIEAGTVTLANPSALGLAPYNQGAGTVVDAGATVKLQGNLGVPYAIEPLNLNGGTLETLPGASKWMGPIKLQGQAPITVTIDVGSTFTDNVQFTNEGTPLIVNTLGSVQFNVMSGTGTVTKVGPGTLTFSGFSPEDSIGAITVNAGALALVNHASLTAPITVNAAHLTLDSTSAISGPVNINAGGTVVDDGTITGSVVVGMASASLPAAMLEGTGMLIGYVNNAGVVSPGDPGGIGTLTIEGPYTQSGTLDIVIGSTSHDVLAIVPPRGGMASASLGGTLDVTLEQGVKLMKGESFVIMTFPAFGGKFQTTNLPPGMSIVYNPTNVTLVQN